MNVGMGTTMILEPKGKRTYAMEVTFDFLGGGKTNITVGSGAEKSVCPWWAGRDFWNPTGGTVDES